MFTLQSEDLDHAPCGFIKLSDTAVITAVNQTFLEILNIMSVDEIIGQSFQRLLSIAGRMFFQTHVFPMMTLHGEAREISLNFKKQGFQDVPVTCNIVRKTENGLRVFLCVFFPVESRKKYEQALLDAKREAERAREDNIDLINLKQELEGKLVEMNMQAGRLSQHHTDITQFSKVISHDLQESIRKISLFSDKISLAEEGLIQPESRSNLQKIAAGCKKLRELTTELERFISFETDPGKFAAVDLSEVIHKAADQLHLQPGFKNITFQSDCNNSVTGDAVQLQILFFELFGKMAATVTQEQLLTIRLECTVTKLNSLRDVPDKYLYTDHVHLNFIMQTDKTSVEDHGNIFEADIQLPAFNSLEFAICKKIAVIHNGLLEIASSVPTGMFAKLLLPVLRE